MSENIIVELTSIEIENIIIIQFVTTETALEKSDSVNYIECGHEITSLCGIRSHIIKFFCSVTRYDRKYHYYILFVTTETALEKSDSVN